MKKVNKNKLYLAILIGIFFYLVIKSPKSSETIPRFAVFSSVKEDPIMFILLVSIVVVPIYLIEQKRKKRNSFFASLKGINSLEQKLIE